MYPTHEYPTLIGRVLPKLFNIRVGSGFSLKNPKWVRVGSGYQAYPARTRPIYTIFFFKKKTLSIDTHFSNPKSLRPILSPSHSLPSRLPFSPSPSLSLEQDRQHHCFASHAHFASATTHFVGTTLLAYLTSPAPLHSPPHWSFLLASFTLPQLADATAPPSPRQALLHLTRPQLSHLPHHVVNSSFCNENRSFCSKNQICNFQFQCYFGLIGLACLI